MNEFVVLLKCKWQEPKYRKKVEIIHVDQDIKGSAFLECAKKHRATMPYTG